MSSSICRAAGRMSISSAVMPSAFISFQAFDLVPSLVAKPGMVKPRIVVARQAEPVADLGRDDQRVRRVEPARDADHHVLAAGDSKRARQPVDLDVERLVAVLVELARAGSARTGKRRIGRISPTSLEVAAGARSRCAGTVAPGAARRPAASLKVGIRIRSPRMRSMSTSATQQHRLRSGSARSRRAGRRARRSSPGRPRRGRSCSRRGRRPSRRRPRPRAPTASGRAGGARRPCR